MNRQPLFTQNPNDTEGGYLVSPAGVLLMVGSYAYEPDGEISPAGRARAKEALHRILSAARAGGFAQGDVLETLMARGDVSARVKELAHTAIEAAGTDAVTAIVQSLKKGHPHD